MYSLMRTIGFSYGTPWKPSTTCGPDAPRPRMKRPSLTKSQPAAVMAINAAVREYTFRIPVPISTRSVIAARYPTCEMASKLYASATQTTSRPAFSRSTTRCAASLKPPE